MGKSDNNRPRYAVEDGHAQVGNGQVDQEVVGQAPHSTVGEHCPQHLDSRDHDDLRIRVPHYPAHAQCARACALRALGLLLADGAPTVGRGKTF